ncbi:hypothetical protein V9T40_008498 [Parthenolecanium corni]|uniref:Uncharacterized protein n=1 Tax=Parthenolecanium corni TaxID=536013 RepID=A0AAN9TLT3_9HEMI
MTEVIVSSRSNSCENFRFDDFHPKPRYIEDSPAIEFAELIHSRSDDLILQNAPLTEPIIQRGISDAAIQIQKDACVVYDDIVPSRNSKLLSLYYSDSETNSNTNLRDSECEPPMLKITGCFDDISCPSQRTSKCIDSSDKIDPEHSIRDIISRNDFYRFVLFKKHYDEYLDISQKYEEARTISYYLEEKYHEVKNQRDSLIESNKELEQKLKLKDLQLQEKEEELFQQIEKVFRLEEDCEKLRKEKEKIHELKEQLQKDKNEVYKQLRLQADESDVLKRDFEKKKNDLIKQFSEIVLEKNHLEKENIELKEAVGDLERQLPSDVSTSYTKRKNIQKLQQQMTDLKVKAKQSATLNSQLKKGMKHLATCRRRKCSVCAYTRATFGEYPNNRRLHHKLTAGCFPFHESKKREKDAFQLESLEDMLLEDSARIAKRLSECSFASVQSYVFPVASAVRPPPHIPFIDECTSTVASEDEHEAGRNASRLSSSTVDVENGFYSDSGFSSELYDSSLSHSKSNSFGRAARWTTSFRKLIKRVSSKKQPQTTEN